MQHGARHLFLFVLFFLISAVAEALQLEIRATSDLHGRLENLARLEPLLLTDRPEVLRIDAGDTHTGGFAARSGGAANTLTILKELRFDCWVPGNHDLELPEKELSAAMHAFHGAVLGGDWRTPACRPRAWTLFRKNGVRVALIGLSEPGMSRHHYFDRSFSFEEHAALLKRVMPEVRAVQPDLIILVRHGGRYGKAGPLYELLKCYPEIRLVIGAHTHEKVPGERVGRAWFVQPGSHGESVAAITAEFDDKTHQLIRISSVLAERPMERSGSSRSPALTRQLRRAREEGKSVAGVAPVPLAWPRSRKDRGASLGLWCAGILLRGVPEADAVCCSLPVRKEGRRLQGAVTERDLFMLFPYESRLRLVELSREELNRLLEDRDFCRYAVPFFAGKPLRLTKGRWVVTENAPEKIRLVTTEYLAAVTPLLRQAPGRMLPFTEFEAARRGAARR